MEKGSTWYKVDLALVDDASLGTFVDVADIISPVYVRRFTDEFVWFAENSRNTKVSRIESGGRQRYFSDLDMALGVALDRVRRKQRQANAFLGNMTEIEDLLIACSIKRKSVLHTLEEGAAE